jgi:hypothetical protein
MSNIIVQPNKIQSSFGGVSLSLNREFIEKNKDIIYLAMALIGIVIFIIGTFQLFKNYDKNDKKNINIYVNIPMYTMVTGIILMSASFVLSTVNESKSKLVN